MYQIGLSHGTEIDCQTANTDLGDKVPLYLHMLREKEKNKELENTPMRSKK